MPVVSIGAEPSRESRERIQCPEVSSPIVEMRRVGIEERWRARATLEATPPRDSVILEGLEVWSWGGEVGSQVRSTAIPPMTRTSGVG